MLLCHWIRFLAGYEVDLVEWLLIINIHVHTRAALTTHSKGYLTWIIVIRSEAAVYRCIIKKEIPVQVFSCKFGKISEEKFFCRIYPGDYLCTLSNKVIPRFLSKYFTEEKKGPKFFQTTQCLREIFVTFVRALQNLL